MIAKSMVKYVEGSSVTRAMFEEGKKLAAKYGTDYSIDETTYAKNQNKGKASVTVRGLGNYGGEKKITYTIGAKLLVWWKNLFYKN